MKTERDLRREIVEIGRWMDAKGFIVATDGNLTCRLGPDRFLATPSGLAKGRMSPEQLIVVNSAGERVSGRLKPTSELQMHLVAYSKRSDVNAVIHAHPPVATSFTIAGIGLAQCVIPEVVITMGAIPTAEYTTPGTGEARRVVEKLVEKCDAMLLDRHGTVTVGSSLEEAYQKLEKVEHCAHVTLTARLLGRVRTLSTDQVRELVQVRERMGLRGKAMACSGCGACGCNTAQNGYDEKDLVEMIASEVLRTI